MSAGSSPDVSFQVQRSIWKDERVKVGVDSTLFFWIPAFISVVLHTLTAPKFISKPSLPPRSNGGLEEQGKKLVAETEKWNRELTKPFMINTAAWIVLRSVFYSQEIIHTFHLRDQVKLNDWTFTLLTLRKILFSLYSVVNLLCFITINQQLQQPFLKLVRLLPLLRCDIEGENLRQINSRSNWYSWLPKWTISHL